MSQIPCHVPQSQATRLLTGICPKQGLTCLLCWFVLLTALSGTTLAQKGKKTKLPSQKFKGYGGLPESVKQPLGDLPSVAAVDDSRRQECRDTAARIDALVEARLAKDGLTPNALAEDYVFVRRVFLDSVGRIPTLVETNSYVSEPDPHKSELIVDQLLSSYGYVSHMYNYWANILRVVDRPDRNIPAYGYREWLKEQLRQNRPYDEWVYDMLTAEGKIWENPAVGYTLRDYGMPLVHVDNTVRVFLGTQIGCAQCHDHPFDKWTQNEFYQLAAFTHGTQSRESNGTPAFANGNPVNRIREQAKTRNEKGLTGNLNLVVNSNMFRVAFDGRKKLKLPHDYQYDDAKPNQVVEPHLLWGEIPVDAQKLSKREQYAAWITSPQNNRFAKTIANRLWKKVMGVGLLEPVDNITDDSLSANDELLEFLTREMIRLDFDQKQFLRTLMYTKTYQRVSSDFDPSQNEFYLFPGPSLRRMTAEQIWDSILTIAVYNPYSVESPSSQEIAEAMDLNLAMADYGDVERVAEKYESLLSPKALNEISKPATYRRQVLVRASELPSPLPADHFLRQFGQCDRETIEGDESQPTVPQILTMFNGPFTHMMLEEGSVIYDALLRATSPRDAMNVMFLTILNRPPTSRDRDVAMQEISRGDRAMGYGNVIWALINTREFLFIQ